MRNNQLHGFHLVSPSPWPLALSFSALLITIGTSMYFHSYYIGYYIFLLGIYLILSIAFSWWRDILRESTFGGFHTQAVQIGLRIGMLLFISSEVMFFFAFFWSFFHSSFNPSHMIGGVWPPAFFNVLNQSELPLLNTIILLSSGVSVTYAHSEILLGHIDTAKASIMVTINLAILFILLQHIEYIGCHFSMSDGIYGSTFFLTTGFHGFHVYIGACLLLVTFIRVYADQFTASRHFGFEAAAWYWHFVDVVWLFLYVAIYWWGS